MQYKVVKLGLFLQQVSHKCSQIKQLSLV